MIYAVISELIKSFSKKQSKKFFFSVGSYSERQSPYVVYKVKYNVSGQIFFISSLEIIGYYVTHGKQVTVVRGFSWSHGSISSALLS
jgi:hypothetical protein